ncbi:hypothetical protein [Brevibacillus migulae]|uniref:hypothetical protein n=1 Tax=Brevibacillus migulae TaxID=1644114 RepID=UPI00106E4D9E|nr:hypothetical protein [Brevibacillus migulae]
MGTLVHKANTVWHKRSLQVFMVIVIAHWIEHLVQAYQVYVLGWPRHMSHGALGSQYPWLVSSELLHFAYAVLMFAGLLLLQYGFAGRSYGWWRASLYLQGWHLFEHSLLFVQAISHAYLFGADAPTSIIQLLMPRIELHLFYNSVVFVPMVIGMYYHARPPKSDIGKSNCTCCALQSAN